MMNEIKGQFINEYIIKLKQEINSQSLNYWLNDEDSLFSLNREIVSIFENEIPNINDNLSWKNGTSISDANILIGLLKKYLIDNEFLKVNDLKLSKFWIRFITWFESEMLWEKYFKDNYVNVDELSGELILNLDYDFEFRLKYGENCPLTVNSEYVHFIDIKRFIELTYEKWIDSLKRYEFTIKLNMMLSEMKIPYTLKKGKLIDSTIKSSFDIEEILNKEMFEDKIEYSLELIAMNDVKSKKIALDLIVDCLEYIISIQEEIKDKQKATALLVNSNENSKLYSSIYKEIREIGLISNEYFDIRHNKQKNNQSQKREYLNDGPYIEYLYYRIYALLNLLRIKNK